MQREYLTPSQEHYDVVIIGGAKIGSSVAWFLSQLADFDGSVLVVERDTSYQFSSTAHTNSCMRQQFSSEINIRISQFAAEFVNNFASYFDHDLRVPKIHFQQFGYLYLANTESFAQALRDAQKVQSACGVGTKIMSPQEIADDYSFYRLDDIILGSHNVHNEGYYDGATVFDWWRRGACENGVEYLQNEVVSLGKNRSGENIESVTLATGEKVACGVVVNAAGPRAAFVAAMADIKLPVEPRKRYSFVFKAERALSRDLPLTIDPSGVHVRSDGSNYLAGCPPDNDHPVDCADFNFDHSLWQDKVWPALANRIPRFESIKLVNAWVGHYAYNTLDQNAVVGCHPQVNNLIFVNGFSGHGFQQAPAMGRGVAELITYGQYRTLDLSLLSVERIVLGRPFSERAII